MSSLIEDNVEMHWKYGVHLWVNKKLKEKDYATLKKFLDFRLDFIEEEFEETVKAAMENNPEEVVDGLIDILVVTLGTLDAFGVDAQKAWDAVHKANMAKEVGVKKDRPNPLGLPDLVKPKGWRSPSHKDNLGILKEVLNDGV